MFGVDEEAVMMGHLLCRPPAGEASVYIAELIRCHCLVLRFSSPSLLLLLFLLFSRSCRNVPHICETWIIFVPLGPPHGSFLTSVFCVSVLLSCVYILVFVLLIILCGMSSSKSLWLRGGRPCIGLLGHPPGSTLFTYILLSTGSSWHEILSNIFPHIYNILHNIKYWTTIKSFSGFYFEKKMHTELSHYSAGHACRYFGGYDQLIGLTWRHVHTRVFTNIKGGASNTSLPIWQYFRRKWQAKGFEWGYVSSLP